PAAPRSLRARFEQLRTSPRIRSPRVGRSIISSRAHSAGVAAHHVSHPSFEGSAIHSTASVLQERADLLERVHDLEDRLKEAYHRNPQMAEFQLMRDEMTAARQEIATLRAERNQLLEQTKRYSMYKLTPEMEPAEGDDEYVAGGAIRHSLAARTIRELEEQLHIAHAQIQQLEVQITMRSLHSVDSPAAFDSSADEQWAEACNESAATPTVGAAAAVTEKMALQRRLDEALQQLEVQRSAAAAAEERLNQEIHAHKASLEETQQLQEELTSVWRRLESTEYQLKLVLEERDGMDDV
ncbi:hypothetical protein DQ04_23171000, partial [Trypanosoma grayi]|uniref:hypothetical protein n=1 Tax=Trypanosoma grayi TaxID=71804 RepID=UPI0004F437D3